MDYVRISTSRMCRKCLFTFYFNLYFLCFWSRGKFKFKFFGYNRNCLFSLFIFAEFLVFSDKIGIHMGLEVEVEFPSFDNEI